MAHRVGKLSILTLAIAEPLQAAQVAVAQVPEPSNLALFAMGLAGVIIGRRAARSRNRRDDE